MDDMDLFAQRVASNLQIAYKNNDLDTLCSAAVILREAAITSGLDPMAFRDAFYSMIKAHYSSTPRVVYDLQTKPNNSTGGVIGVGWPIKVEFPRAVSDFLTTKHHPYILPIPPEEQNIRGETFPRALLVPVTLALVNSE